MENVEIETVTPVEAELLTAFRSCDEIAKAQIMTMVSVGVKLSADRANQPLAEVVSINSTRQLKTKENHD